MAAAIGQKPADRRNALQQLTAVLLNLDPRRRVIVALATVAMFAAVLTLGGVASRPAMALLYAGLDGNRAGEVLTALDQRGVVYEVRGEAIYVPSADRDALRMTLAAEGLPANSAAGYELLDALSGFGTTSQMFDAAYLRAKEGELARTIGALPMIRSARVHVAVPQAQGLRAASRPTASVAVATAGGGLSPVQAKALKFLVASAVSGMSPEDVSVIDGESGLVISGDDAMAPAGTDRAGQLRQNVERLLEARVGYGNAIVEVSVDTVTEREAITERRFDPEGRVAISTDTLEQSTTASDSGRNAVTVASNLPAGDAGGSAGQSQSNKSETRERTNFEVSETTRELLRNPGAVRRLTVAVLVDAVQVADAAGALTEQPRGEAELQDLQDLVAAAVGFDAGRGDVITIRSMPFKPVAELADSAGAPLLAGLHLDLMRLVQLAVLAIVTLVLGLFVVRPILTTRPARLVELPAPPGAAPAALTGEIDDGDYVPAGLSLVSGGGAEGSDAGPADGPDGADPVTRLRRLISERQEETVEILRNWMEDPEEEKA